MTGIIAVPHAITERDATLIKAIVAGIVPEIRAQVDAELGLMKAANDELTAANKALADRLAQIEQREIPDVSPLEQRLAEAESKLLIVGEKGAEIGALEQRLAEVEKREVPDVEKAIHPLAERIAELEAREPIPGPPGPQGPAGERGMDGKDGRDGIDLADLVRGEDGHIIVTLSNGATRDLGSFKGEKGDPGDPGPQGPQGEKGLDGRGIEDVQVRQTDERTAEISFTIGDVEMTYEVELPQGPMGEKGEPGPQGPDGNPGAVGPAGERGEKGDPGERGADGFGFEDMEEELAEDGRTIVRRYRRGEEMKEFTFHVPAMIDRGTYRDGKAYERGDTVTFGGGLWIAQKETKAKPGDGDDWRLAVRRGRDGKPGKDARPND